MKTKIHYPLVEPDNSKNYKEIQEWVGIRVDMTELCLGDRRVCQYD